MNARPFKIAAICTQYYPFSHADVIVTRWLEPHVNDAQLGFVPSTQIASLWVMQHPEGDAPVPGDFDVSPNSGRQTYDTRFDISQSVSQRYAVPIFPTIRAALTLGGEQLGVNAVLLIGEHGQFPRNDYGQILYPRKELFDEIVKVFQEFGQVVPIFCDKHLSWNITWAQEMIHTAKTLGIPLFAGSSAPISGSLNDLHLAGEDIAESLGLFYVGGEVYGIHSLEYVQSLVEQRIGGESGIVAVRAYVGDDVWAALARGEWSRKLFEATLSAAITAHPGDFRTNCAKSALEPVAFICEHADGHRQTHIMLDGHIQEFVAGVRLRSGEIRASTCNMGGLENFVVNFTHLDREIQKFFLTRRAPIAIERVLLTTMTIATLMHALKDQPSQRVLTPHLGVAYKPLPYTPMRISDRKSPTFPNA